MLAMIIIGSIVIIIMAEWQPERLLWGDEAARAALVHGPR
jgi:hypothetical protein